MDAFGLIAELRRRRVFRALIGWAVVSFAVLQIIEPVLHALHWPDKILTWGVALLALGFPLTAAIAWLYQVSSHRERVRQDPHREVRAHPMVSRRTLVASLAVSVAAIAFTGWNLRRQLRVRWVRDEAIPEIANLLEQSRFAEAVSLAEQVKQVEPAEPALLKLWPQLVHEYSVTTEPPGAELAVRQYASRESPWIVLGTTPLARVSMPRGFYRWRLLKRGFEPLEVAPTDFQGTLPLRAPQTVAELRFKLEPEGTSPAGMVRVPGARITAQGQPASGAEPALDIDDFFIDKFEVTNAQFKAFLDDGGYRKAELWEHVLHLQPGSPAVAEAGKLFVDRTGRAGPADWISGDFPAGEGDLPVTGVSWFEAEAYAEWKGKSLPSVAHWRYAASASAYNASPLVQGSNFSGVRLLPVGASGGLGAYGTYDLFGNAKEWCWNAVGNKRPLLGGAFDEPAYMAIDMDARIPLDRSSRNGFRLVRYLDAGRVPPKLLAAIPEKTWPDFRSRKPLSNEVFQAYSSLYSYDPMPLNARVEAVDERDPHWRKERISLDAAYGGEHLTLFVFLPRNVKPPYQTVIHFPGSFALSLRSSEELDGLELLLFLVKAGRAVVYPVYKSTYERGDGLTDDTANPSTRWRDHVVFWMKDVKRAVDYVQSRPEFDKDKIAFYGRSWGGVLGPVALALEPRIKVGLLVSAGLEPEPALPEVEPVNFAPRVKQPVLIVNGRLDFAAPFETSQRPLFELLGTPPENKRLALFEGGHRPDSAESVMKEILDWLDKYFEPPRIGGRRLPTSTP